MALPGAHVSTEKGIWLAPGRARDMGCESMQVFSRSRMRWHSSLLDEKSAARYKQAMEDGGPSMPVLAHASYLINLGCPDAEKEAMSKTAFLEEMDQAEQLGIEAVVFHPGAHLRQMSEEDCLAKIATNLNWVMKQRPDYRVKLYIENTAGQGSNLGYRFKHLKALLDALDQPERAGICLDTCHAFAAGYDLRTPESYQKTLDNFDEVVGLENLKAVHLNDSKKPLNSRRDRHADLGTGEIGMEPFELLMSDPRFQKIPMILETPQDEMTYKEQLDRLKNIPVKVCSS